MTDYYGKYFFFDGNVLPTSDFSECITGVRNRIYEVLRVVNGKPLFLFDHFMRFQTSCNEIELNVNYAYPFVEKTINDVISINNIDVCNIRFEVLVKNNDVSYICFLVPWNYPEATAYREGVAIGSYSIERPNPHIKQSVVNSKIRQELARHFSRNDYYEILLVDHFGHITEGSRTNVFFVKDGTLYSPPSKDILEGITRKKILEIAVQEQIKHIEEDIPLHSLADFDACFLSGTSPKILPVRRINQHLFTLPNQLTSLLMKRLDGLIEREPH